MPLAKQPLEVEMARKGPSHLVAMELVVEKVVVVVSPRGEDGFDLPDEVQLLPGFREVWGVVYHLLGDAGEVGAEGREGWVEKGSDYLGEVEESAKANLWPIHYPTYLNDLGLPAALLIEVAVFPTSCFEVDYEEVTGAG